MEQLCLVVTGRLVGAEVVRRWTSPLSSAVGAVRWAVDSDSGSNRHEVLSCTSTIYPSLGVAAVAYKLLKKPALPNVLLLRRLDKLLDVIHG